jgi:hypothetical protein
MAAQSPALVISIAALFLSLGSGAGYAATLSSHPAVSTHETHLVSAQALPQSIPHITWTALSVLNTWSGNADGDGAPAFGVNGSGILYLRGAISTSTSNTNDEFAILPPGNRPSHYLYLPIYTDDGGEGSLEITTAGAMYVFDAAEDTVPQLYSSLSGLSFVIGE